jgi:hypothetical protein
MFDAEEYNSEFTPNTYDTEGTKMEWRVRWER